MPDQAGHDMAQIDQRSDVVGDEGKDSLRTSLPGANFQSGETGDRDVMVTEAEIPAEAGAQAARQMKFYRTLLLPHLLMLCRLSAPKNSGASSTPPLPDHFKPGRSGVYG